MVQLSGGIGNVTTNTGLVEMAMAYSRSRVLCAAARLGVADALGDEVRSVGFLAEKCEADADALYRLLRALASIGVTEETTPEHFRLTPFGKPLRRDVPHSVWSAVIFWADLLAADWSLLTDCVRPGFGRHACGTRIQGGCSQNSLRGGRSFLPMRTDCRRPDAIGPSRCRCVHAQTCSARASGRGGNHDSQELPRGHSAERQFVDR